MKKELAVEVKITSSGPVSTRLSLIEDSGVTAIDIGSWTLVDVVADASRGTINLTLSPDRLVFAREGR